MRELGQVSVALSVLGRRELVVRLVVASFPAAHPCLFPAACLSPQHPDLLPCWMGRDTGRSALYLQLFSDVVFCHKPVHKPENLFQYEKPPASSIMQKLQ